MEVHATQLASVQSEREKGSELKQYFKPFIADDFNISIKLPMKPFALIFGYASFCVKVGRPSLSHHSPLGIFSCTAVFS